MDGHTCAHKHLSHSQNIMDLSIVVISSPSPSHPSTFLIENCLLSARASLGLPPDLPLFIILDGYKIASKARMKLGKITSDMEGTYSQYQERLPQLLQDLGFASATIHQLKKHHGFALAVKAGLQLCKTKYVLVLQHDRIFRKRFDRLPWLLSWLSEDPRASEIRYLGFPTQSNNSHDIEVASQFLLPSLHDPDVRIELLEGIALQPALHWWDSQHLAVRTKYLEIFSSMSHVSGEMVELLGGTWRVSRGLLRPGDFIEDRFGQWLRLTFREAKERRLDDAQIKKIFRFFSSYLIFVEPEYLMVKEDVWAVDMRGGEGSGSRSATSQEELEDQEVQDEDEEDEDSSKNGEGTQHEGEEDMDRPQRPALHAPGVSRLGGSRAVSFVSHLRGRTLDFSKRQTYIAASKFIGEEKRADRQRREEERHES